MTMETKTIRLPPEYVAFLEGLDEPTFAAGVRRVTAEAMRRREAADVTLDGELSAAWKVLRDAGSDTGDRFTLRLEVAETRLADRMNTPKAEVRHVYLERLRQAGVVDVVPGSREVRVWVAKAPEEAEEVPARA